MKNNLQKCRLPKNKHQSKAIRQKYRRRRLANQKYRLQSDIAQTTLNRRQSNKTFNQYEINNTEYTIVKPRVTFNETNICYEEIELDLGDYHIIDPTNRQSDVDKQINDMLFKATIEQYLIVN